MGFLIGVLAVLAVIGGVARYAGPDIARYLRMRKM
jgi:hypothetical protein